MRFAFIQRYHDGRWTIRLMCEVLEVSRSGYYRWLSGATSERALSNETLEVFLREQIDAQRSVPGYRKLWRLAVDAGFVCSKNRVHRLLQRMGYRSVTSPKRCHRDPDAGMPVLPNLLNRDFEARGPGQVWVSDITQIRCLDGWLYLALVLDLYGRRPAGIAMGPQNTADLVCQALERAKAAVPMSEAMLFHSDQGSQYRSEAVMGWLNNNGSTISMSRVGNCWDNACAESFFALLKREWTRTLGLIDRAEMQGEIEHYVNEYYMEVRIHESLGGKTPARFLAENQSSMAT